MLTLTEIEKYYPENLRGFKRFILREYLQHKILQIIFESEYASRLAFLGGTCLRIVYGNNRFSEDLDFDNFGMGEDEFQKVAQVIERELEKEGYLVEMKTILKGAFHCHIRFPELLYKEGLSGHLDEKILIQLDTEPQNFEFTPERFLLNRFDVFTQIFITPKDLLLAQKFYAILNRPRNKGRDFYDIVFLLASVNKPNYDYLSLKAGIRNAEELKRKVRDHCNKLDMNEMGRDVAAFLFNPADVKKVVHFPEYIEQVKL
jgi:predicted nucleotidyltransferase component of viral defense system